MLYQLSYSRVSGSVAERRGRGATLGGAES